MQELKREKQESDSEDDISYEEYLQQVKVILNFPDFDKNLRHQFSGQEKASLHRWDEQRRWSGDSSLLEAAWTAEEEGQNSQSLQEWRAWW